MSFCVRQWALLSSALQSKRRVPLLPLVPLMPSHATQVSPSHDWLEPLQVLGAAPPLRQRRARSQSLPDSARHTICSGDMWMALATPGSLTDWITWVHALTLPMLAPGSMLQAAAVLQAARPVVAVTPLPQ